MDFNRMLHEKKFYLAILLAFAGILAGTVWPELEPGKSLSSGTFLELLNDSLQSQTVLFLLPLAAVLPCGEEYLREKDSHFLRLLIIRRDKTAYCLDKVVTTALSGAIVWLAGAGSAGILFFLLFFWREAIWDWPVHTIFTLLATLGRVLLCASALASLSDVAGALGGSVYLAFGAPFLLWYACIILRERYFEALYCIDPTEWISAENDWGSSQLGLWIFLNLLAFLSAVLHWMVLETKLREV